MINLYHAEALDVLRQLPSNSIDSLVTDPPAGISFMGKAFDTYDNRTHFLADLTPIFAECLRVLKPGGHGFVWSLPRTSHWTAFALEDAGFEVREKFYHIFGCLTADAEILTSSGWRHHDSLTSASEVMAYDCVTDAFEWQSVEAIQRYAYDDTAYRIHGHYTEHVVSRGHRCVVERGGRMVLLPIEHVASECEARIPVVEDVQGLLSAVCLQHDKASSTQPVLFDGLCLGVSSTTTEEATADVPRMQKAIYSQVESGVAKSEVLLGGVLRQGKECRSDSVRADEANCSVWEDWLDSELAGFSQREDEWREESSMEGRGDVLSQTRELQVDQVCTLPTGIHRDGPQRRIHNGTSADCSERDRPYSASAGSSSSRESRSAGQSNRESSVVCDEPGSQVVRGARFTASDLVRISEEHYSGIMWCVTVPSGAFVARANGQAFVTGNSGFPKSANISKQIDAQNGDQGTFGEPKSEAHAGWIARGKFRGSEGHEGYQRPWMGDEEAVDRNARTYIGGSEAAKQWAGWGTATKPAAEEWILVRKPLAESTVASNVLTYGTGALNIDKSRVACDSKTVFPTSRTPAVYVYAHGTALKDTMPSDAAPNGRWPSNVLLSHTDCKIVDGAAPECSPNCPVAALDAQSGVSRSQGGRIGKKAASSVNIVPDGQYCAGDPGFGDTGGASRYFKTFSNDEWPAQNFIYLPKPSTAEKNAGCEELPIAFASKLSGGEGKRRERADPELSNHTRARNPHPTVKSVALMRYLITMITPPGGLVLDPFLGSGTTAVACKAAGFDCIGIENVAEYIEIAKARVKYDPPAGKVKPKFRGCVYCGQEVVGPFNAHVSCEGT